MLVIKNLWAKFFSESKKKKGGCTVARVCFFTHCAVRRGFLVLSISHT